MSIYLRKLERNTGPTVIVINGFLSQNEPTPETSWYPLLRQRFAGHSWSFLEWESKTTHELYRKIQDTMSQNTVQQKFQGISEALRNGNFGLVKNLFDSYLQEGRFLELWRNAQANALESGTYLGNHIAETSASNKFILIGYSLGAVVAAQSLRTLLEFMERKILAVHFLGGAISTNTPWKELVKVVSQGIYNYYSMNDLVLGMAYNQFLSEGKAIGSSPIGHFHPKIIDRDVSSQVENHRMYKPRASMFVQH